MDLKRDSQRCQAVKTAKIRWTAETAASLLDVQFMLEEALLGVITTADGQIKEIAGIKVKVMPEEGLLAVITSHDG